MSPLVVHCKKKPFDVLVDRTTKWGNPFLLDSAKCMTSEGDRAERKRVIERYEHWLRRQPRLMGALPELRGKVLGCHCAPKACHAEVLVRLANQET
jgi:hypothetical protein